MIGDKLVIKEHHTRVGRQISEKIVPEIKSTKGRYIITVAGESGAGKSETAHELARFLEDAGVKTVILGQDDYFVLPPKSNEAKRREDISWVGKNEVKIDLLEEHCLEIRATTVNAIKKPLVIFDEDKITEETLSLNGVKAVLIEGTYITSLENVDCRIFIDRTYKDTKATRAERARETQDDFLTRVLEIEHKIISADREKADILIKKDYTI